MPLLDKIDSDFYRAKRLAKHLKENYHFDLDYDKMTLAQARRMKSAALNRITTLKENRGSLDNRDGTLYQLVVESLNLYIKDSVRRLTEDEYNEIEDDNIEEAEVIIAAQAMSEEIQKMIENLAEMQVQDLLPLVDRMKDELGQDRAASFERAVDEALTTALDTAKETKSQVDNAILSARGVDTLDIESDEETPDQDSEFGDEEGDDEGFDLEDSDDEFEDEVAKPEDRELKPEVEESFSRDSQAVDLPDALVAQIEERAENERNGGGSIDIDSTLPSIDVVMSDGEEYHFQEHEADEILDAVPGNIGAEDYILAMAQNW